MIKSTPGNTFCKPSKDWDYLQLSVKLQSLNVVRVLATSGNIKNDWAGVI
jgi:hypothetical protein